ncbi:hypothetical protein [Alteromonas sp. BZK5]|uniref:hypothetical protein n=1 Tax=Alteromonas sp. BZK5 TaxID=1904459 RepID=UPI001653702C|nr:hypothetical protein [Alteromonas sp. BZK5]MBC6987816.1 hypothetical protein [Alteromonas sp. BZK5]
MKSLFFLNVPVTGMDLINCSGDTSRVSVDMVIPLMTLSKKDPVVNKLSIGPEVPAFQA